MNSPIGLISGAGRLPQALAAAVKEQGHRLAVIRAVDGAFSDLESAGADAVYDLFVGAWDRVVAALKSEGVQKVYLVGKISREHLLAGGGFDDRARAILGRLDAMNDDAVVKGFIADLESEGMVVGKQTDFLGHLLCPAGVLTRRQPTDVELADVERGYQVAKALATLDVGQTAVVRQGAVVAVEAVDGTDQTIRRGGAIAREGAVVVKVAKPRQDLRFDVPVVGLETLETMAEVGCRLLAVEAGLTLILEKERFIRKADERGIAVLALAPRAEADDS